MQIVPLSLIPPVAVEDLDAVVLTVGHIHQSVRVRRQVVRQVELPRIASRLAPGHDVPSVRRVLVDARIAVAVRDEQIARAWADGDVRGTVEGLAPLEL